MRSYYRSSYRGSFVKKGVLKNFTKLTGKQLRHSLFFNEVTDLENRLWHRCFPVNFAKFLRIRFFIEQLRETASPYWKTSFFMCSVKIWESFIVIDNHPFVSFFTSSVITITNSNQCI